MTFVDVWIGYAIFGAFVFSAVFVWAVRSRQFTELDRQRYIALRAEKPLEHDSAVRPSRVDRYTCAALLLLTCGVISIALWLGLRNQ
ncbi:MAG: cbb3-type cytochrome oxidase assembly protein CcoS [Armatimonadota bacterium]|nr:cbb3-type cytochrome oxidase assembly protein CcoS [Armatimonadota bacterium]